MPVSAEDSVAPPRVSRLHHSEDPALPDLNHTAPTTNLPSERRYDLDWLRVLAFGFLILYHVGMAFVPWNWHIKNPERSPGLGHVMGFVNEWRLPLLFVVSGAAVWFSLGRRGTGGFARERLVRLALPLGFAMLVIVPPQIYYERLFQGVEFTSYLDFYPTTFTTGAYPEGNLSWHHMWYVAYVLTFSLLALPLLAWLQTERGRRVLAGIARVLAIPGLLILMLAPLAVSDTLLRRHWSTTMNLIADWANFSQSLILFVYGFIYCSDARLRRAVERARWWALAIGITLTTVYYAQRLGHAFGESVSVPAWAYWSLKNLNMLAWLVVFFGWASRLLDRPSPLLRRATEAVYPYYILHQTITVMAAYYIVKQPWGVAPKFVLLTLITFGGCFVAYESVIRRWKLTRVLFGMKPTAARSPVSPSPEA